MTVTARSVPVSWSGRYHTLKVVSMAQRKTANPEGKADHVLYEAGLLVSAVMEKREILSESSRLSHAPRLLVPVLVFFIAGNDFNVRTQNSSIADEGYSVESSRLCLPLEPRLYRIGHVLRLSSWIGLVM